MSDKSRVEKMGELEDKTCRTKKLTDFFQSTVRPSLYEAKNKRQGKQKQFEQGKPTTPVDYSIQFKDEFVRKSIESPEILLKSVSQSLQKNVLNTPTKKEKGTISSMETSGKLSKQRFNPYPCNTPESSENTQPTELKNEKIIQSPASDQLSSKHSIPTNLALQIYPNSKLDSTPSNCSTKLNKKIDQLKIDLVTEGSKNVNLKPSDGSCSENVSQSLQAPTNTAGASGGNLTLEEILKNNLYPGLFNDPNSRHTNQEIYDIAVFLSNWKTSK